MTQTLKSLMSRKSVMPKAWPGFVSALRGKDGDRLKSLGAEPVNKANMGESSGIFGGYAVPPDFNYSIATSYEEHAFFYPRAFVVPMVSRTTSLPRPNVETPQASGVPPWWGGMTFSWGLEGGTVVQTNLTLAQNQLVAKNLIGSVILSNDLLQDYGPAGDEWLFNMFASGSAWNEEYAFFNGDSVHQPQGIIGASGSLVVNRAQPGQIGQSDVSKMAGAMIPGGWTKAIWACSPDAFAQVTALTGWIPNQVNFDVIGITAAGTLHSRPLFVTDKLPPLGTKGDLVFFDPTKYLIGERAELIVQIFDQAPQVATINSSLCRIWRRVDGQPLFSSTITLPNQTTCSPQVILN